MDSSNIKTEQKIRLGSKTIMQTKHKVLLVRFNLIQYNIEPGIRWPLSFISSVLILTHVLKHHIPFSELRLH